MYPAMSSSARAASLCMFSQNGLHHRSNGDFHTEDSPPRRDRRMELKLNEALQRPRLLGLCGKPRPVNRLLGDSQEVDDESLPNTPVDTLPDVDTEDRHSAGGEEALDSDTRHCICNFLEDYVRSSPVKRKRDKVQTTMRRVVENVLDKHQRAYNGMINKLALDSRGEDMSVITSVATSVFADGTTNWGRIASLVAFGAAVSQYQKAQGREHCVPLVAQEISSYLLSHQREWLLKNDSWAGFVEFFQVADPEATVRTALMAFAGIAGLGATIALLIR